MYRLGLDTLYALRLHRLLAPACSGVGVIFTLHHVRPVAAAGFAPNAFLEVTPEFLDAAIKRLLALGTELVSLADARQRLLNGSTGRFACFTLDDGYRDNIQHALPVFEAHRCPFTIFLTTGFLDQKADIYWKGLEAVIASQPEVETEVDGIRIRLATRTPAEKLLAYRRILAAIDTLGEDDKRAVVRTLCRQHGVDMEQMCRDLMMSWDEARTLAAHPLASLGAHTVNHVALKRLCEADARREIEASADRIAEELGTRPALFAYPYGSASEADEREFALVREAGFELGVTTRPGVLKQSHASRLLALPRVSLNGLYQEARFVDVLASGVPFTLLDQARRLAARCRGPMSETSVISRRHEGQSLQ